MTFEPSEAQVAEFEDRGVLTLDFGFDAALLDAIVEQVAPLYPDSSEGELGHGARIQDAWRRADACRRLATDARVLAALQRLFGRAPRPFQTLNFPTGTSQPAHSDSVHFNSDPPGYVAGVWVALEDVDERNGALVYYPGSHLLPEYTMQDFGLRPSHADYAHYEEHVGELISKHDLPPEVGILRRGQAVLWHSNLLHGGRPHVDPTRSRHSQVTHYYFEGCRYYTPMTSGRILRSWRSPDWIPAEMPCAAVDASLSKRIVRRGELGAKRIWYAVHDLARAWRR